MIKNKNLSSQNNFLANFRLLLAKRRVVKFIFLFVSVSVWAFGADFITQKEYAKMLYENPRGISCKQCHGKDGREQVLEYYIQKGVRKPFIVPNIQNISFKDFLHSLKEIKGAKNIMPTYSLTDDEIKVLYEYIQDFNKDKK